MMRKTKNTRVTLDLEPEDYEILEGLMSPGDTKARLLRKAIRILDGLNKEEIFLHTPKGERIPRAVIFS